MPSLIGQKPNQVPTNGDLGTLAFQDANAVNITGGNATLGIATANTLTTNSVNLRVDSDISNISPTLLLDFANTKVLDPRITFTRASTATFYDGRTVAKAEENLLLQSQDFTTTWTNVNSSDTSNTTIAPDGTTTADTITATGTGAHYVQQTSLSTTGTQRVLSCFVKAGTNNYVQLGFGTSVTAYANFNVTSGAGAVGTVGATATASIVDAGGGWYRCIVITSDATASALCFVAIIQSSTDARLVSFSAAGTETILVWGAQLEQRSAVTAYTPTTTDPITNYIPALQTAASGVARFDHNPITQESLGLLIEEQRANVLTRSDDFADSGWAKANSSIVSNTVVAPDGTLTADKHVPNSGSTMGTGTAQTRLSNGVKSYTGGTSYTASIYAKAGEFNSIRIGIVDTAGNKTLEYNLSTGVASVSSGTGATATMTSVGNGWWRCVTTWTHSTTESQDIRYTAYDSTTTTGDGYKGVYLWGAQLEAGAFPTSYIPTVASTVTRNADAASMTGTNFSSWYRANEGTIYTEFIGVNNITASATRRVFETNDNSANNRLIVGYGLLTFSRLLTQTNGATQADITVTATPGTVFTKCAAVYKSNDFNQATNATLGTADTSAIVPIVSQINIGAALGDTGSQNTVLNGTIKKIAYFPQRLPNAELIEMTT